MQPTPGGPCACRQAAQAHTGQGSGSHKARACRIPTAAHHTASHRLHSQRGEGRDHVCMAVHGPAEPPTESWRHDTQQLSRNGTLHRLRLACKCKCPHGGRLTRGDPRRAAPWHLEQKAKAKPHTAQTLTYEPLCHSPTLLGAKPQLLVVARQNTPLQARLLPAGRSNHSTM